MKTNPIFLCLYGHAILSHTIDLREVCLDILSRFEIVFLV